MTRNLALLLVTGAMTAGILFVSESRAETVTEIANRYSLEHSQIDPLWPQLGNDLSSATRLKYKTLYQNTSTLLQSIDPLTLNDTERDTYELLKNETRIRSEALDLPLHLLFSHYESELRLVAHVESAATWFPFQNLQNYEDYITRSRDIPFWVDSAIAVLNEGIEKNIVVEKKYAQKTLARLESLNVPVFEDSVFSTPVKHFPDTIAVVDRDILVQNYKYIYDQTIYPQIKRLIDYYKTIYLPKSSAKSGLSQYGEIGKKMYAHQIEFFTDKKTSEKKMSPADLHQLGLNHVKDIVQKLEALKKKLDYKGTLAQFLKSIAKNANHHYKTPADMIAAFTNLKNEFALQSSNSFNIVPKTDYVFLESPWNGYTSPNDSRPYGVFHLNTSDLKSLPTFESRTVLAREASFGRHFQLALSYEKQSEWGHYRAHAGTHALQIGWADYAELLAKEMGLYPTPLDQVGFWKSQLLSALRVVVDTGIHHHAWSHEKALQYLQGYAVADTEGEVTRAEILPGYGLSGKIGQIELLNLRAKMQKQMGEQFNIRDFHDRVLGQGVLSVPVLGRKF